MHQAEAGRDRGVERLAGNATDGKHPNHHGEPDVVFP
jgi:hypothetical protein